MKRNILLLLVALLPMVASAYDAKINGIYYNFISENEAGVTYLYMNSTNNSSSYSGSVVIPSSVKYYGKTYSVTSIGWLAFSYCSGLTSITIPESVTSIGDGAFYDCTSLTSVTIPNSVTSIGGSACSECSGLTSITIPESVTSIGQNAFSSCRGLTSVTIPNSVTSIGNYAFSYCSGLTSITIPNSVTSIGYYAFQNCTSLTSVTIPNSVTSIGGSAFSECSGLTSITIPESVTSIGDYAFYDCSSLTSVTIPNSVTSIGWYAFPYCRGLTSITIGNSVTSIGGYAFAYCSGLTSVTIGNAVTSIGNWAFIDCSGLTDVYCYAENVPNTDSYAFSTSPIASATLHVPAASVEAYSTTKPWSGFGQIVAINATYTLTYYVDGKVYKTYEVEEGSAITPEPAPTKEGYTFSGWTYIPPTMPAADVVVMGSFTINSYTLTYKVDGEVYKTYTIEYGAAITPEPEPTKEGYTFSGWSEIPETMPAHNVTVNGTFTKIIVTCAKPTISYANGKLTFNCETEDVIFHSTITDTDITSYLTQEVELCVTYTISVYATKEDYEDSEVATGTLCWIDQQPSTEGIVAEDAVTEVKALPVLIQSNSGTITIQGANEGTEIMVYSVNGMKQGSAIATNGFATINTSLRPGSTAIVKIGEKAVKVLIK